MWVLNQRVTLTELLGIPIAQYTASLKLLSHYAQILEGDDILSKYILFVHLDA